MKKWMAFLLVILALALTSVYFFIPSLVRVRESMNIRSNSDAAFRCLSADTTWKNWWPGSIKQEDGRQQFIYQGNTFLIRKIFVNNIKLVTALRGDSVESMLSFAPNSADSCQVVWGTSFETSLNPINRIRQYLLGKELSRAIHALMPILRHFLEQTENTYGFNIKQEQVQYEYFATTRTLLDHYPSTGEVYDLIGRLRKYVSGQQGKELGYPMLNVTKIDQEHFEMQVGLPTDKQLKTIGSFSAKWMPKGGYILTTEVTGGQSKVDAASSQVSQYIEDHHRNRVAIPFQSLITDRSQQPDSSQWVTKIYYPVI